MRIGCTALKHQYLPALPFQFIVLYLLLQLRKNFDYL